MADKKVFNLEKEKVEEPSEEEVTTDSPVEEPSPEIKETKKPKKLSGKMVPVQIGEDKSGNPTWKFVPEEEASSYQ